MNGTTANCVRARRLLTRTLASAKGTIAAAYHGRIGPATGTKSGPYTTFTTNGPNTASPAAPHTDSITVPIITIPTMLVFSDFAELWTMRGNITAARGLTSQISALERVPALPYAPVAAPVK